MADGDELLRMYAEIRAAGFDTEARGMKGWLARELRSYAEGVYLGYGTFEGVTGRHTCSARAGKGDPTFKPYEWHGVADAVKRYLVCEEDMDELVLWAERCRLAFSGLDALGGMSLSGGGS